MDDSGRKPPRAPTAPTILGDRDVFRPKTPPAGVAAQSAAPETEIFGEQTNPHAPLLEQIATRQKRQLHVTTSQLLETKSQNERLESLELGHAEMKGEIADARVDIGGVKADVANLRVDQARGEGKLDMVLENVRADREERADKRRHRTARERWAVIGKVTLALIAAVASALAGHQVLK